MELVGRKLTKEFALRKCMDQGLKVVTHDEGSITVERKSPKVQVGNGTLGLLDYLEKHHAILYVNKVERKDEDF